MAFTNNWDNNIPSGAVAANQIDEHIRRVRLDVYERLASIFKDINADPLELKSAIIGAKDHSILSIAPHGFMPIDDEDDIERLDTNINTDNSGGGEMYLPLMLPVGMKVRRYAVLVNRGTRTNAKLLVRSINVTTGAAVDIVPLVTKTTAGIFLLTHDAEIEDTVAANEARFIRVSFDYSGLPARGAIYGVQITYDSAGPIASF